MSCRFSLFVALSICAVSSAQASVTIPLTVNLSEAVTVTGTPRVAVDVGGQTRYATYSAGTGTTALTFTLTPQAGDVDLDGIAVSSPIDLNGGTIKDLAGNNLAALTFTPPNTSGIKVNYPSLGMDFAYDADGRYTLNGTAYNDLPSFLTATGGTFTRTSTATYFDSTGTLQIASANTPRFDYDPVTHTPKGLLIEESRTNSIRNSTMQGASIGAFPTNWTCSTFDFSCSVVGTGTEDGMPYIDVRMNGTVPASPSNTLLTLMFDGTTSTSALAGQTWVGSVPVTLQAGTARPLRVQMDERNAGGGLLSTSNSSFTPVSGSLKANRYSKVRTLTDATTGRVTTSIRMVYAANEIIDMTIRIGQPQLEMGTEPSSYIPTTTAAVTRGADFLRLPVAAWHNASEGAIYAQTSSFNTDSAKVTAFASFDDNTVNNRLQFRRAAASTVNFRIVEGGSSIVDGNSTALWTDTSFHKYAAGYKSANNKVYFDGTSAVSFLVASAMPTVTQLQIGSGPGSSALNGYLKSLKYYPTRVPDAQLQLLTQ